MRVANMILGLALSVPIALGAGAALACPSDGPCGDRYSDGSYERWSEHGYSYDDRDGPRHWDRGYDSRYDRPAYDDDDRYDAAPPPPPAPYVEDDGRYDDAYDNYGHVGRYSAYDAYADDMVWFDEGAGWYVHGHRADPGACGACAVAPPCGCGTDHVALPLSFFADAGGVGPIPAMGWYDGGGGLVIVGGRESAGAFGRASSSAFASAHASSSASVSIRGGRWGGGHGHGGKGW